MLRDEFLFWTIPYRPFDSDIVIDDDQIWFIVQQIANYRPMRLIYSIERDGPHAKHNKIFHQKCDGIPNTITFIEADTGAKFGGFASVPWQSKPTGYAFDNQAKIFHIRK